MIIFVRNTNEGKRRYDEYKSVYGENPQIKDVLDACYYGLMTEDEVISRIKQGDEAKKKFYAVVGWISLIIFAIWLMFSVYAVTIAPSFITYQSVAVGGAGVIYSTYLLKSSKR